MSTFDPVFLVDILLSGGTRRVATRDFNGTNTATRPAQTQDYFYAGDILNRAVFSESIADFIYGVQDATTLSIELSNGAEDYETDWDTWLASNSLRGTGVIITRYDSTNGYAFIGRGKVSAYSIGATLSIDVELNEQRELENIIPAGTVTADDFTATAIDVGTPINICFGYCRSVPLPNIQNDTTSDYYDYLIGYGQIEGIWDDDSANLGVKRDGVYVNPSEYTLSYGGAYPGMSWIRFTKEQLDFSGNYYDLTTDVKGLLLGGATANRNFATVIENILSDTTWGLSLSTNSTSFATAETDLAAFYCDGAITDQTEARDYINDLLFLCRSRLSVNADGEYEITVDKTGTSSLTLADFDGYYSDPTAGVYRNCEIKSVYTEPLKSCLKKITVNYLFDPLNQDHPSYKMEYTVPDRLGTARTYGTSQEYDLRFVSDTATAKKVLSYLVQKSKYGERKVRISADPDAIDVAVGDIITVVSQTRKINTDFIVESVDKTLAGFDITASQYDDSIYSTLTITDPTDPTPPPVPTPYALPNYRGEYNAALTYYIDDTVKWPNAAGGDNNIYICIADSTGNAPSDTTYWEIYLPAGTTGQTVILSTSTQAVEYDSEGAIIDSSDITITATPFNTSGTILYKFYVDDVYTGQHTTSNTYAYTPQSLFADMPETIKVEVNQDTWDGDLIATDQITLFGIRPGTNAHTVVMSNEAHTLPASSTGVVSDYSGSGTTFRVYEGAVELDANAALSANSTFKVEKYSNSSITCSTTLTHSGKTVTVGNASSMTGNTANIVFKVTVKSSEGKQTIHYRTQTFSKSIAGVNGENGLPIVWKGDLASHPIDPITNWAYRNTGDGRVYIFDGSSWELMVLDGTDGPTGAIGDDGLSVYITYHDSSASGSAPALPTNAAGDNNGWHTNATSDANWMSQKVDDGTGTDWGAAIKIKGVDGVSGVNSAVVFLYKRAATTPTKPSTTSTYTFSTGVLTGQNNGWTQSIPSNDGNPAWAIQAVAQATAPTNTDTIASGEWGTQIKIVEDGLDGLNQATINLYQRKSSAPAVTDIADPITYTFATKEISGTLGAWAISIPSGTEPLYITSAVAVASTTTDTIDNDEWSTPVIMAQNGYDGDNATQYYIKPTNGTAIKNSTGTLTIEAHKVDGTSDTLLSSGTIQLYDGATALGYSETFDSADISGSKVITLKNGSAGTVLDSITLVDITDGIDGDDGYYGYIDSSNGLAFIKDKDGAWTPSSRTTNLYVTIVKGGVEVGRIARTYTADITTGVWTESGTYPSHPGGAFIGAFSRSYTSGSGTRCVTIKFTLIVGGVDVCSVSESLIAVIDGEDGPTGPTGPTGPDGEPGPGVVYRGEWASGDVYYNTSTRRDIVSSGGAYYIFAGTSGENPGTPPSGSWESFGATFSSIATGILLAQDATITQSLVMGTSTDNGLIRSYNRTSSSGTGFYMEAKPPGTDNNGCHFVVGDTTNYILFNQTGTLAIYASNFTVDGTGNVTVTGNLTTSAGSSINADYINAGTLAADRIAAGSLHANKLTGGTITATQLSSTNLSVHYASTGSLSVTGTLSVSTSGKIQSGKTSYGAGTGWLMEYNSGSPRLDIGDANNYIRWNGSSLSIVTRSTISLSNSMLQLNETVGSDTLTLYIADSVSPYLKSTSGLLTLYASNASTGKIEIADSLTPTGTSVYIGQSADYFSKGYIESFYATTIYSLAGTSNITLGANMTINQTTYAKAFHPSTSNTYNLGTSSYYWSSLYVNNIQASSTLNIDATTIDVDASTISYVRGGYAYISVSDTNISLRSLGSVYIYGTVYPWTADTYNIGSSSARWATIYAQNLDLSGDITCDDITCDLIQGTTVDVDASTTAYLRGGTLYIKVTSTAIESFGNLSPGLSTTYHLGTSTKVWNAIYAYTVYCHSVSESL